MVNRWALLSVSLSLLVAVMLPFTESIGFALGATESFTRNTLLIGTGAFLLMAAILWRNAYRWAMPGLLLQIDRCGCCGMKLDSRRKLQGAMPTASLTSRCTECGTDWSAGTRVDYVVSQLEHVCNAA